MPRLALILATVLAVAGCDESDNDPALVALDPPVVEFGTTAAGSSVARQIEIANVGVEAPLTVLDVTIEPHGGFVLDRPTLPQTLSAGASIVTTIRFEPLDGGTYAARVAVSTDVAGLARAALAATATAAPGGPLPRPTPATISASLPLEIASIDSIEGQSRALAFGDSFVSGGPSVDAMGRFVAFSSILPLVPGDANANRDLFVRDRLRGTTTRVSFGLDGREIPNGIGSGVISADGGTVAYVAFTGGIAEIIIHDLLTARFERPGPDGYGIPLALTPDGGILVFESDWGDHVTDDSNGKSDIFVYDRATQMIRRVSVAFDGTSPDDASSGPAGISADGRRVIFQSLATNIVQHDVGGFSDVFVRDLVGATNTCVSLRWDGQHGDGPAREGAISADGRWVAFSSAATELIPGDQNAQPDIYVRDLDTDTLSRASLKSDGTEPTIAGSSRAPSLSGDGRFVAFRSTAPLVADAELRPGPHVYVRDRTAGSVLLLDRRPDGGVTEDADARADPQGITVAVSRDGRYVAFDTFAGDLDPRDANDIQFWDVFVAPIP